MIKETIREIMKKYGHTNASLAEKCGYAMPTGVANALERENGMRVDTLIKMLDAMGCELVIRSADGEDWLLNEVGANSSNQRRIAKMEEILNRASADMDELERKMDVYRKLQDDIKTLDAYYSSDEWKQDFELDEQGKLPNDLKRGVLSEDAIYNLLEHNKELMSHIKA